MELVSKVELMNKIGIIYINSFSQKKVTHVVFAITDSIKGRVYYLLGAIHKLLHTNFMIVYLSPVLVTGGHISELI